MTKARQDADDARPDPDLLLAELQRDEAAGRRGRLKVFFGACAGVGKTYAMLTAARIAAEEGRDVVVGVVETHGRPETEACLEGLERLPLREVELGGRRFGEFDLDAALARGPSLLLVDELAHNNAPGSRHGKRWQDVEELLGAGIDVWTALNVQHLESLNDIVGQITGIRVRETVPDRLFDDADEVSLVDLPLEELLRRLQAGKVYLPQQAERAQQSFFRKGNLLALRELALRRTADRVDAQMRAYRDERAIQPVWQARERLLVCVDADAGGDRLVRRAARLAAKLHADWLVAYVETPALQRLPESRRQAVLKTLALAQELGAETSVLAASDLPATLVAYARSRNVSKFVLGAGRRHGLRQLWRPPLAGQLARLADDIDCYCVAMDDPTPRQSVASQARSLLFDRESAGGAGHGYAQTLVATLATTAVAAGLLNVFDLSNVVMVYLLLVVLLSIRYGRRAGILASLLSVLAFDFFFVEPRLSFTVADTQYLFTFGMLLAVALIISQLAARLRFEARVATFRERRTHALYDLGRELAGALTLESVLEISRRQLGALFQARIHVFLPGRNDELAPGDVPPSFDTGVASWALSREEPAGLGTRTLPGSAAYYLPLKAPMRVRGVLALVPSDSALLFLPEQHRLLEACASQIAQSLERLHFVEIAQEALVAMSSERLRNSVLSAVSHDLRTPLTTLSGLAGLLAGGDIAADERQELAQAMQRETRRLAQQVDNLLDMARLQSGVPLKREWQLLDDVVGSALAVTDTVLCRHDVSVSLAPDLPMLQIDAVLMERVLVNLLENAAKYTPPGSRVLLSARRTGGGVEISVADDGPGLPAEHAERLFEKFTRGQVETTTPGVGLGLAICQSIVEAHGGRLAARHRQPRGAEFSFTLPISADTPPSLPEISPDHV